MIRDNGNEEKGGINNFMADSILKNLNTRLIKMNFSSIVFLLDIIIWLLNIQSLKNLITGKDWNALLNLAPEIMIKIYNLYFLVAFSVIWLVFNYFSKSVFPFLRLQPFFWLFLLNSSLLTSFLLY